MKHKLYNILAAGFVILLLSCVNTNNKTEETSLEDPENRIEITKEQFQQNNMAFGAIEIKEFPVIVNTNGMIDVPPENRAKVNAIIGGYIKTTPLLEGDMVKKGQLLVTIENPEFVKIQQEYMEVKEQLSFLEAEYNRQKTLLGENITSQKSFLNAESNYKTALAKFNGLNKQLTMLNISPSRVEEGKFSSVIGIYAPINGSIAEINVSKGSYVSPTTEVMEIIDNSHIHLELTVFEKDIMKIKKGQPIRFRIPEAADKVFDGEVYLVGTSIDENRTIKVHGHPTDESHNFLTGMFVNAEILIDSQKANALPENAVVEGEKGHFILVLDDEQKDSFYFKKVKVDVTNTSNNYTFFNATESLNASRKILTKGAYGVLTN